MNAVRLSLVKAAFVVLVGLTATVLSGCEESTVPAAPTVTIPTPAEQPLGVSDVSGGGQTVAPAGAASTSAAVR